MAAAALSRRALLFGRTAAEAPAVRPPWALSFSFGRALQHEALHTWAGSDANRAAAQQALLRWTRRNGAAVRGKYLAEMETP